MAVNKQLNEHWRSVIDEFEQRFPFLAEKTVDWYPSSQYELTVRLDDGNKFSFNWLDKGVMKIYDSSEEYLDDEEEWRKAFALSLHNKMRKLGISQDYLAEHTGISRVTISQYINARSTPSTYNLQKIARVLKCSTSELLYRQ